MLLYFYGLIRRVPNRKKLEYGFRCFGVGVAGFMWSLAKGWWTAPMFFVLALAGALFLGMTEVKE